LSMDSIVIKTSGADMGFDPEFPASFDDRARVRTWNALHTLNLEICDAGVSPTDWQKNRHPEVYRNKIDVIHEGIDTELLDPVRTHFLGRVPYNIYRQVLQVSAAHVYLTYPFVLSWSMLEAMASGCLVIGSQTAPVEEVLLDGENGLLVDFFDREAIADRVIEAREAPEENQAMRKQARQDVAERFSRKAGLVRHRVLVQTSFRSQLVSDMRVPWAEASNGDKRVHV
jgi:hypothetical protein